MTDPTTDAGQCRYWMSPVNLDDAVSALDVIATMLRHNPVYFCWGPRSDEQGRSINPGDRICVYACKNGGGPGAVVADAIALTTAQGAPELVLTELRKNTVPVPDTHKAQLALHSELKGTEHLRRFPRTILLGDVDIYERSRWRYVPFERLHRASETRTLGRFVQRTRLLDAHDFSLLTGKDV